MINSFGRAQGVRLNSREERKVSDAPPRTILNLRQMTFYAAEFTDEDGQVRTVPIARIGKSVWIPPNAEQWAKEMAKAPVWLAKAVEDTLEAEVKATNEGPLPADTVDVMNEGGA